MNRQLNIYEILLMIGGANIVLGLTVFGSTALYFGFVVLAMGAATTLYFSNRASEASRPKEITFASADGARAEIDDAARVLALSGDGWAEHRGTWAQSLTAVPADDDPFRIDCSVASSGDARLVLVPGGEQRETIFELFPFGPAVPFGADEFLRLVKALGGSTSPFDFSGLLPSTGAVPRTQSDPDRNTTPAATRLSVTTEKAAPTPDGLNQFCTSCGEAFEGDDLFCTGCGAARGARSSDRSASENGVDPASLQKTVNGASEGTSGPATRSGPISNNDPSSWRSETVSAEDGSDAVRCDAPENAAEPLGDENHGTTPVDLPGAACTACGTDLRTGASFCIRCGHAVADDDVSEDFDPDRTVKRKRR